MSKEIYGYIRVSTKEQNVDRQCIAMQEFGVPEDHVYIDKQSGKDFDRPAYRELVAVLKPGDTLAIKSIDRLGRNYDEMIEEWRNLTKNKGIQIAVLDMPFLNALQTCDMLGKLIADIMLYIMSYFAQMEREMILQRQSEGIAAAKLRGVQFGRKPMEPPAEFERYRRQWSHGKISANQAAKRLGIGRNTFLRWARKKAEESSSAADAVK